MNFFSISRLFTLCFLFTFGAARANDAVFFEDDAARGYVFAPSPVLPVNLKRVVVLPLVGEESRTDLSEGCEMLGSVLQAELVKTKKFEVVPVGAEILRRLTGRPGWTGAEVLPADFFDSLHREYGCDAVLFCQLTTFRAFAPLAVGWRMKLVDVATQKIIWAADEVFDADEPAVVKGAQQFQKKQQGGREKRRTIFDALSAFADQESAPVSSDQWTILNSPRYFGQYSAVKLLQTLPER